MVQSLVHLPATGALALPLHEHEAYSRAARWLFLLILTYVMDLHQSYRSPYFDITNGSIAYAPTLRFYYFCSGQKSFIYAIMTSQMTLTNTPTAAANLRTQAVQATDSLALTCFDERIEQAERISDAYATLWRQMKHTYFAGGKRLRPYLAFVGFGEFNPAITHVALAQELLHVAMLIHDDIIDRDTVRHGQKNLNGLYLKQYTPYTTPADALHYAHSTALIAGDALISEAYQLLAQSQLPPEVIARLTQRMHQSIFEVVGGELLDTEAGFVADHAHDPLVVYRYKTAGYSFIGPLLSGAICADASSKTMHLLEQYGIAAGIAFQMQDDLLGVFGEETITGKSTLSDLKERKNTSLIEAHKAAMNGAMTERFNTAFSPGATEAELLELKQDLQDSGAKATTEQLIDTYFQKALEALDALEHTAQANELRDFTALLRRREA